MILLASIGFCLFFMVLAQAMDYNIISKEEEPEAYCLAQNILFESSTEPLAGKIAVALVVLNRVNDARYPNTVCAVIKEGPVLSPGKQEKMQISSLKIGYIFLLGIAVSSVGFVMGNQTTSSLQKTGTSHR